MYVATEVMQVVVGFDQNRPVRTLKERTRTVIGMVERLCIAAKDALRGRISIISRIPLGDGLATTGTYSFTDP